MLIWSRTRYEEQARGRRDRHGNSFHCNGELVLPRPSGHVERILRGQLYDCTHHPVGDALRLAKRSGYSGLRWLPAPFVV
jgi:hypothetical protein